MRARNVATNTTYRLPRSNDVMYERVGHFGKVKSIFFVAIYSYSEYFTKNNF